MSHYRNNSYDDIMHNVQKKYTIGDFINYLLTMVIAAGMRSKQEEEDRRLRIRRYV